MVTVAQLALSIDATLAKKGAVETNRALRSVIVTTKEVEKVSADGIATTSQVTRAQVNYAKAAKESATVSSRLAQQLKGVLGVYLGFRSIRGVIRVMSDFELHMETLSAVAIRTTSSLVKQEIQFSRLRRAAFELGATTQATASEAAEGLLFLARTGFSVQESIEALPDALNLAIAGHLELGDAADIASNVLKQFTLDTSETVDVVDTLVITANRANTEVSELAKALVRAGPVAGKLGLTVGQTTAALGALSDVGLKGRLSGRNLRIILTRLNTDTKTLQQGLEGLGLTFEDVAITGEQSFSDVLRTLKGISVSQAAKLVGAEAGPALLSITTNEARATIAKLERAIIKFEGEAEKIAKAIANTLVGAFKSLTSATQAAIINFGDTGFTKAFRDFIFGVTDGIRVLGGFDQQLNTSTKTANRFATAIVFLASAAGIPALTTSVNLLTTALVGLGRVAFLTPLGLTATVVGSLTAILFANRKEVFKLGEVTVSVGEVVRATWERMKRNTAVIFTEIKDIILTIWNTVLPLVEPVGNHIVFFFEESVTPRLQSWGNNLIAFFRATFDTLSRISQPDAIVGPESQRFDNLTRQAQGLVSIIGDDPRLGPGSRGEFILSQVPENQRNQLQDLLISKSDEAKDKLKEVREELKRIEIQSDLLTEGGFKRLFEEFRKEDIVGELIQSGRNKFEGVKQIADELGNRLVDDTIDVIAKRRFGTLIQEEFLKGFRVAAETLFPLGSGGQKLGLDPEFDLNTETGEVADAFTRLGNAGARALERIFDRASSLKDILRGILTDLGRIAFREFIGKEFASFFGDTLRGSKTSEDRFGGAYSGGRRLNYALGGIVGGAAGSFTFPINGGIGRAGEIPGQEEGILPLRRNNQGQLGVLASGGGGNMTIIQNITTPDVRGFRNSRRQITRDAQDGFRRGF